MRKQTQGYGIKRWLMLALRFTFLVFGLVILVSTIQAYRIIRNLPNPERLTERSIIESTKIYDRTGKVLLYEVFGEERRTVIPFNEVPDHIKWATITAEDANFYQHIGLDWRGIIRAIIHNIRSKSLSQGGSTITQQLVKNSFLSPERTITRKFKEAMLSLGIESHYTKDEILGLYINQIPYGSNAYGIAAAADTFFDKTVDQLTIEETALLAALPQAPTYYSPYGSHVEELMKRKDWILDRMTDARHINGETGEAAKKKQIQFTPPKRAIRAPHFVMYVREYLNEKYGEDFVQRGGLRVITTLDWEIQEKAERIILEGAKRNEALVGAKNAALVAIDPKNGDILAMVGSRDYFDIQHDGNVNVAIRPRQPGSAFKPFIYATAFERGYTPETTLFDVPTEFNPSCAPDGTPGPNARGPRPCYHPKNFDNTYRGPVTIKQSLAQSLNIPSVKLLYLAGIKDSINTAKKFGITTLKESSYYGLTLVLGGGEVTLLEMVSAYGAFAQDGILHTKSSIVSIEDAKGNILEQKKDISLPVINTHIARTINGILSDNNARIPVFSPTSSLYFPHRHVAAKTGTTQDYRDAWVIGYTPSLVAGVWVGNNDNTPMRQEGLSVMVAGPIWHEFVESALYKKPNEVFAPPKLQTPNKPVFRGMYRSGGIVKIDRISKKLATAYTPTELIEELNIGEPQTILSFIAKNDPLGASPNDPTNDPQFFNWQTGIQQWIAGAYGTTTVVAPQEVDDIHTPEKLPRLTFVAPSTETMETAALTNIRVRVQSAYPLQEVLLFVDDVLITSRTAPFSDQEIDLPTASTTNPGTYQVKVIAYDNVGNSSSIEHRVSIIDAHP